MKRQLSTLAICLGLLATSCNKSAVLDPIIQEAGTSILSGNAIPSSSEGKEGDFYIDLSTQTLYGPKQGTDWGTGIVLSGSAGVDGTDGKDGQNGSDGAPGKDGADGTNGSNGQDGKNGNTILNGKGAPSSTIGELGDFYFDTQNMAIYGAKTSTGWGTPVSLKPDAANNGIRILIKENYIIDSENMNFDFFDDGTEMHETILDFPITITTGDIEEYLNNGTVIIQSKIGEETWYTGDNRRDFQNGSDYFTLNLGFSFGVNYNDGKFTFMSNYFAISTPSKSEDEAKKLIQNYLNQAKVSYKFTLIPASTVEKLGKSYPGQNVDKKFVAKYFSLAK